MSNTTKFSYGLKLSKNAGKAKPNGLPKRKAVFGSADDGSDDDATSDGKGRDGPVEVKISELGDDFLSIPAPPSDKGEEKKRPAAGGTGPRRKNNPLQPPTQPLSSRQKSSSARFDGDLATNLTARKYAGEAEALDPSVYDYDASYDAFKAVSKKTAIGEGGDGDGGRKPQYMSNVRKMAELRERDRRMAEDKKMQREREAEGDEFVDKEKFVTEAYKQQQEENRRLEAEERRREEEEERKAAARGGGMTGFYKQLLDRDEQQQAAIQEALKQGAQQEKKAGEPENADGDEDDDVEGASMAKARAINARGGDIAVNDEGEVVDKRQLLRGGLNVSSRKRAEIQRERERSSRNDRDRSQGSGGGRGQAVFVGSKQAMRDRQSRMLEAQYEQALKRTRDEEEEQAKAVEETAKTRKTAADISSAKERYLARKRAEAEAKKLEQAGDGL